MLGRKQEIIKEQNIAKVVRCFVSDNLTINQVALKTGISSSSVQRYLNDEISIRNIFGIDATNIINTINDKLMKNKQDGKQKGGRNYSINNVAIKDELGHFVGSRKR